MNTKSLFLGLALTALASPVAAETYLGRCQMGECLHYDQSDRRVEGHQRRLFAGRWNSTGIPVNPGIWTRP